EASRCFQDRMACVDQCERSDDVDLVDASKDLKRVFHERRERGRTQFGGVVDQEVETTGAAERGDQVASVLLLCHISGDGRNGCAGCLEAFHGLEQRTFVARGQDERPALPREKLGDGVSEPAARPGDQGDAFGWTVSVMRRTLRHGHPRPSAIYVGSPVPVLGLTLPSMRAIVVAFAKDHKRLTAAELNALASALWSDPMYEEKSIAILLLGRYEKILDDDSWRLADEWVDSARGWALSGAFASG